VTWWKSSLALKRERKEHST